MKPLVLHIDLAWDIDEDTPADAEAKIQEVISQVQALSPQADLSRVYRTLDEIRGYNYQARLYVAAACSYWKGRKEP